MTWIDWVIIALVMFSLLQGLRRGPFVGFFSVLGLIVAFVAASGWHPLLADTLTQGLRLSRSWAATAAFFVLLGSIYVAIGVIATTLLSSPLSVRARLLGAFVGAVKGILLAMMLLAVAMASPLRESVGRDAERSRLAPYAVRVQHLGVTSLARILPAKFHLLDVDRF